MIVDYSVLIVCALGIAVPAIIGIKFPKWQYQCMEFICYTATIIFIAAIVIGIIKIFA